MSHSKPVQFKLTLEGEVMSQEVITFSLSVNPPVPPPSPLVVVDANGNPLADGAAVTLKDETVGVADSQVLLTVSGGVPPYTVAVSAGALPPGDSLSTATNADGSQTTSLAGTPTTAGPTSFGLTVSDSAGASATIATASKPASVQVHTEA
jgi:hypothetical protein